MAIKSRIGEVGISTFGEKMEIIEYVNNSNITVKFEDGTVVSGKTYGCFKDGRINNTNYYQRRIGEENMSKHGQKMKIVAYRSATDIDVQFENGTIVTNKTYRNFQKGTIDNPVGRIGESRPSTTGEMMTIIAYRGCHDMDIQFEDGTIVTNKTHQNFMLGEITNPNYMKNLRLGETNVAKCGLEMKIVEYRSCEDLDVEFEDGVVVKNKRYGDFQKSDIAHPNYQYMNSASVNEFAILYYLKQYGFIKANKGGLQHLGFGYMELDCYHPTLKIAIEYDGSLHHKIEDRDLRKNQHCRDNGIHLIRIREPQCGLLNDDGSLFYQYQLTSHDRLSKNFENTFKQIINEVINKKTFLNINTDLIDFERDRDDIVKQFYKHHFSTRVGETNRNSKGEIMKIIKYFSSKNITIEFEDGTIVTGRCYQNFKKGTIRKT